MKVEKPKPRNFFVPLARARKAGKHLQSARKRAMIERKLEK